MTVNGIDSPVSRQARLGALAGRLSPAALSLSAQDVLCAGLTWCAEQTPSAARGAARSTVVHGTLPVSASVATQLLFSWRITR